MSVKEELEKLRDMRAELETESHSLIEKQQDLENSVQALREKVLIEEMKKERALIEDLKNRNKATMDIIARLQGKKKELETRLEKMALTPEAAPDANWPKKRRVPLQEPEEDFEYTEVFDEDGVIIQAIDDETLIEPEEQHRERKKRRFF